MSKLALYSNSVPANYMPPIYNGCYYPVI